MTARVFGAIDNSELNICILIDNSEMNICAFIVVTWRAVLST